MCRQLRQRPDRAGTKVIFLSAKSRDADVQKGYEAGADLYIPKPFSTRQLMEKVRELLGAAARCAGSTCFSLCFVPSVQCRTLLT